MGFALAALVAANSGGGSSERVVIVASLITAVASVGVGLLTFRASRKSAEDQRRASGESSRSEAERDAYVRAESFWQNVVDRLDRELAQVRSELAQVRSELAQARADNAALRANLPADPDAAP